MVTCAGTSFLFSLYGHVENTPRAVAWMQKQKIPLTLTSLGEYELGNALRFAEFRKGIAPGQAALFWAEFEADRARGRIDLPICNLSNVLTEAKRLSATHTLIGGYRSFDILHIAAALVLKAERFLTFDKNQRRLAKAEELTVPL